jgi:hypothetical protein
LRVELYDKLAAARDEVIDAENRLVETQRAFDDAKEQWDEEHVRLRGEVEEARQALMSQLQASAELRQSFYPPLDGSAADGTWDGTWDGTATNGTATNHPATRPAESLMPGPTAAAPHGFTALQSHGAVASTAYPASQDPAARSLSALVGFQTTEPNEEALAMAVDLDQSNGKRKGFGLGRLFRSK